MNALAFTFLGHSTDKGQLLEEKLWLATQEQGRLTKSLIIFIENERNTATQKKERKEEIKVLLPKESSST